MNIQTGVYSVKEYNRAMTDKYHKDCQKWDQSKGGFPQIASYIFEFKTGFVLVTSSAHKYYKTKKEATESNFYPFLKHLLVLD